MCVFEFRNSVLTAQRGSWLGAAGARGGRRVGQGCGGRPASSPAQRGQGTHTARGPLDAHLAHTGHSRCSTSAWGPGTDLCLVGREPEQAGSWRVGGSEDRNHTTPQGRESEGEAGDTGAKGCGPGGWG